MTRNHIGVVFVHGLFSSSNVWDAFSDLIESDSDLAYLDTARFEYATPKFLLRRFTRRIPSFDDIADKFKTFIDVDCAPYDAIAIVTHSQGGLVVQRYLERTLNEGHGYSLAKVKGIVMFACPNSGSQVLQSVRKAVSFIWLHPQVAELSVLDSNVQQAQRKILNDVINASGVNTHQCHIPFCVYAGESDNVVTRVSASWFFPNSYVLAGDHNSIIQPASLNDGNYKALKKNLQELLPQTSGTLSAEHSEVNPGDGRAVAFAWASDLSPSVVEPAVDRAVNRVRISVGTEIRKLRFEGASDSESARRVSPSLSGRIVKASKLAVVISDDPGGSIACRQLMRSAAAAGIPVVVLTATELTTETTLEILEIESEFDSQVDYRTIEEGDVEESLTQSLIDYLGGKSSSALIETVLRAADEDPLSEEQSKASES